MTLDEFENRIDDFQKDLLDLTPILTEIGNEMTIALRAKAPGSGRLKRSIRLTVEPQQFGISMLAYGVFQNYGVVGVDQGSRAKNPRVGQIPPNTGLDTAIFPTGSGTGGRYQFGVKQPKYRGWGAYYTGFSKNVNWFNIKSIAKDATDRLQQRINQAFQ